MKMCHSGLARTMSHGHVWHFIQDHLFLQLSLFPVQQTGVSEEKPAERQRAVDA